MIERLPNEVDPADYGICLSVWYALIKEGDEVFVVERPLVNSPGPVQVYQRMPAEYEFLRPEGRAPTD